MNERNVLIQSLMETVARLSPDDQRTLWNLLVQRGLIQSK